MTDVGKRMNIETMGWLLERLRKLECPARPERAGRAFVVTDYTAAARLKQRQARFYSKPNHLAARGMFYRRDLSLQIDQEMLRSLCMLGMEWPPLFDGDNRVKVLLVRTLAVVDGKSE